MLKEFRGGGHSRNVHGEIVSAAHFYFSVLLPILGYSCVYFSTFYPVLSVRSAYYFRFLSIFNVFLTLSVPSDSSMFFFQFYPQSFQCLFFFYVCFSTQNYHRFFISVLKVICSLFSLFTYISCDIVTHTYYSLPRSIVTVKTRA